MQIYSYKIPQMTQTAWIFTLFFFRLFTFQSCRFSLCFLTRNFDENEIFNADSANIFFRGFPDLPNIKFGSAFLFCWCCGFFSISNTLYATHNTFRTLFSFSHHIYFHFCFRSIHSHHNSIRTHTLIKKGCAINIWK